MKGIFDTNVYIPCIRSVLYGHELEKGA